MGNAVRRIWCTAVLAAGALTGVAACSNSGGGGHAPAPAVSGPRLTGRLTLETSDGGIGRLALGADGKTGFTQLVAAAGVSNGTVQVPAALSPDGTTLAYTGSGGVTLQNLKTGEKTALPTPDASSYGAAGTCVNWSPDGQHLAIGDDDGLYVTDLAGRMTRVASVTTQEYTDQSAGSSRTVSVSSSFNCGSWLNPTELVFNQSGPFPATLPQGTASTLPVNTTTVAAFSGTATPVEYNSPSLWSIVATCGDLAITSSGSALYLLKGLTGEVSPAQAAPAGARIADSDVNTALFIPDSCQPIVVQGGDPDDGVIEISPQSRHTVRTWQLPDDAAHGIPVGDGSDGFTWSPQSGSSTLGYVSNGQLYLVDLDTGGVTTSSAPPWGDATQILGWTS